MSPGRIEIRIDELVLQGVSVADRLQIAAALEGELARVLAERGVPQGMLERAEWPALAAGSFARGRQATAAWIGGEVARAVDAALRAPSPAERPTPPMDARRRGE